MVYPAEMQMIFLREYWPGTSVCAQMITANSMHLSAPSASSVQSSTDWGSESVNTKISRKAWCGCAGLRVVLWRFSQLFGNKQQIVRQQVHLIFLYMFFYFGGLHSFFFAFFAICRSNKTMQNSTAVVVSAPLGHQKNRFSGMWRATKSSRAICESPSTSSSARLMVKAVCCRYPSSKLCVI